MNQNVGTWKKKTKKKPQNIITRHDIMNVTVQNDERRYRDVERETQFYGDWENMVRYCECGMVGIGRKRKRINGGRMGLI